VSPYRWLRRAEHVSAPDGETVAAVTDRPRPLL